MLSDIYTQIGFSFTLPSWLPLEDFHKESKIQCTVYATTEGIAMESGNSSGNGNGSPSTFSSDIVPNGLSARFGRLLLKSGRSEAQRREIDHRSSYLERNDALKIPPTTENPPAYGEERSRELIGTHRAARPIKLVHRLEVSVSSMSRYEAMPRDWETTISSFPLLS